MLTVEAVPRAVLLYSLLGPSKQMVDHEAPLGNNTTVHQSLAAMDNDYCIVTGANAGIGKVASTAVGTALEHGLKRRGPACYS